MTEHQLKPGDKVLPREPLTVQFTHKGQILVEGFSSWQDESDFVPADQPIEQAVEKPNQAAPSEAPITSVETSEKPSPQGDTEGAAAKHTDGFVQYRRSQIAELRPWTPCVDMVGVSISKPDADNGSPKRGDMIARNPKNHADKWLVAEKYFKDNFEPVYLTIS